VAKISQPINIDIGASDLVFAGISIIIFIVWEYKQIRNHSSDELHANRCHENGQH